MKIPQSLDEVRRMSPDEQRQAGEMLGRLLVLGPEQLAQVTKIRPEELQGLMGQAPGAPSQSEAPGQAPAPLKLAEQGYTPERKPGAKPDKNSRGNYGVLSNLVKEPEGLTIRDTRTGASRPAQPGEPVGPTEVLMAGNQILRAGLRAQANLRIQSQKRVG